MQSHEQWLSIAEEDLSVARVLLREEWYSSSVYHCQQSAEKSFKAYLAFRSKKIIKTHDLIILLKKCNEFDVKFSTLINSAQHLKPFATQFRYPSEFEIPDYEDTLVAIKYARKILRFIRGCINSPESEQKTIFED